MKRSEMLNKLELLIRETKNIDVPNESYYNPTELAKEILKVIEKTGMKAPEAYFKANNSGCLCTLRESCPSCGGFCNEWEPEND